MPLNIAFWGGLHPEASSVLREVDLSAVEMLLDIAIVIAIPFALGLTISHRHPVFAKLVQPWVKRFSLIALVAFILIAFAGNIGVFIDHIALIALAVFLQDTLALSLGYGIASSFRLSEYNRRAVTFEVGIRNAGLGLGIVFSFFDGIGGMALVAGWWGIWDIIAGLILAGWWARRRPARPPGPAVAG
jgi:BASS family bile acid:Na+ symporter